MPRAAPIAKTDAVQSLGATVHLVGQSVDESVEAARSRAAEAGMVFIHPFDDPDVISGQGGVGLELLDQVPGLSRIIVPVGGGGLISGIAVAVKSRRPDVEVIGVQVQACAPFPASLRAGRPVQAQSAMTIADGIAVKRPGEITLRLVEAFVDRMLIVDEDEVAEAMVFLLERAKLVVEGAGAVGVAALMAGKLAPAEAGVTVAVLSGGNVGAGLLAEVTRRHETQQRRRLVMSLRLPDMPGRLAELLALIGGTGANLVDVQHIREGLDLHIQETAVNLVLETRGPEHAAAVRAAISEGGYEEATEIL